MTDAHRTCGAWWNDPENCDTGYACEREEGHGGPHCQSVYWPQDASAKTDLGTPS